MKPIITPDDVPCHGEIVDAGAFICPKGCDPDDNLYFLDEDGLTKVTHHKCRACGHLEPFWELEKGTME